MPSLFFYSFFFFNDTATTEIYTLSLHDALPIWILSIGSTQPLPLIHLSPRQEQRQIGRVQPKITVIVDRFALNPARSEEHTSELQSRLHLVCRLLLEKKKKKKKNMKSTMSTRDN